MGLWNFVTCDATVSCGDRKYKRHDCSENIHKCDLELVKSKMAERVLLKSWTAAQRSACLLVCLLAYIAYGKFHQACFEAVPHAFLS